jgi:hypothetical protein
MERLSDGKRQEKLAKAFKAVISAGLVAPVFVSVAACGKEQPAVEEVQADEQTTVIIETTPETQETQPVVEEAASPEVEEAKPVEWEGIMINPIEGLRFDNGAFFAQENNPYGLEAETKAGVFIKDAFELNGQMENSIVLRPEVIEVLQKKALEEDNKFLFLLPFDFKKNKKIKIKEVEDASLKFSETIQKIKWAPPKVFLVSNIPLGSILSSPVNSDNFMIRKNTDDSFIFGFKNLVDTSINNLTFEGKKIDSVELSLCVNGIDLLSEELQEKLEPPLPLITNIKIGVPFGEVIEEKFLEIIQFDNETGKPIFNSNEFSMSISLCMVQGNQEGRVRDATGYLQTALDNLLTLTTNEIVIHVSLMPADEI